MVSEPTRCGDAIGTSMLDHFSRAELAYPTTNQVRLASELWRDTKRAPRFAGGQIGLLAFR